MDHSLQSNQTVFKSSSWINKSTLSHTDLDYKPTMCQCLDEQGDHCLVYHIQFRFDSHQEILSN